MGNKHSRAGAPSAGRAVAPDFWSPSICFLSQPRFVHPSFHDQVAAGRVPLPVPHHTPGHHTQADRRK